MTHNLAETQAPLEAQAGVELLETSVQPSMGDRVELHEPEAAPNVETEESTLVDALIETLTDLGVGQAFGVSGGAIALLYDALTESSIKLRHFRHETGAAFAATESYFASRKPSVVFATTGPGVLNALTGMTAAKWDGAKVILISGSTSPGQRGRWATQETSSYTMPQDALYSQGPLFDFAIRMEHPSELPEVERRLALGLSRPGGFVAHICLPMGIQAHRVERRARPRSGAMSSPCIASSDIRWCSELLKEQSFVIWAGFGATESAGLVRQLAERTGAKVMCSPRGKGIMPESHPLYLGVTGLGGHEEVTDYMRQQKPRWVLVLGTRLGEATSFWDSDLEPSSGFIHVDLNPDVPGTAYPASETLAVQAEIGQFLTALLKHFPERLPTPNETRALSEPISMPIQGRGPVRPQVLMQAIQRRVVSTTDALVLAECGNSFAWCNHYLRFPIPARYRVSTLFGSMGHVAAGVVGAALARQGKAIAVVGDGSMMMNSEISTAVQYQAAAVWIVLNDSGYGMCRDGHQALGLSDQEISFPQVDFVGMARAMGADGVRVETEDMLDLALERALNASGPFVIDVVIDSQEASPLRRRFDSLIKQGSSKNVAGWDA